MEYLTGAEIFAKSLVDLGVDTIFAYPGGPSLNLEFAVRHTDIRVIAPRMEQAGAFAADGYGRSTGRPGVCLSTSGPGATNTVTAIADCYKDRVPALFVSGQVSQKNFGKDVFQEIDFIDMVKPITKAHFQISNVNEVEKIVKQAYLLAQTDSHGPVYVEFPLDIQTEKTSYPKYDICDLEEKSDTTINNQDIEQILQAIRQASRPLIIAGGGVKSSKSASELKEFAHLQKIPVITTMQAPGLMDPDDSLYLHNTGLSGTSRANNAIKECDLLLCFGVRFSDHTLLDSQNFAPNAKIVNINIKEDDIDRVIKPDVAIVADVKDVLKELNNYSVIKDFSPWLDLISTWNNKNLSFPKGGLNEPAYPHYIVETIKKVTKQEAIVVPGTGQITSVTAMLYRPKGDRLLLSPGGFASMGGALPIGMGAKLVCPDKQVIVLDGDGSFQMNIQELATIFIEQIDIKIVINHNNCLGQVKRAENIYYGGNHLMSDFNKGIQEYYPDFAKIAETYGIPSIKVTQAKDLEPALQKMLRHKGAFVVECYTLVYEILEF
ncbi:MAG: thiamine pyrophosphate-binding protein [Muribaculaceae bacterium]|nr:thiamine pyrophosphate-binding protein [Muribaculaceae bacterium]